jgi:hypothetical protein
LKLKTVLALDDPNMKLGIGLFLKLKTVYSSKF